MLITFGVSALILALAMVVGPVSVGSTNEGPRHSDYLIGVDSGISPLSFALGGGTITIFGVLLLRRSRLP